MPHPELERRPLLAPELRSAGSARGAGDERGHDAGGVAIQGLASSVIAHRGARVSVAGCFLYVARRNTGVERSSDERMSQRVRSYSLSDPRVSSDATDDPPGGMTVESLTLAVYKGRPFETVADCQIEGPDAGTTGAPADPLSGSTLRTRASEEVAFCAARNRSARVVLSCRLCDSGEPRARERARRVAL
jgi:hypothetical protein